MTPTDPRPLPFAVFDEFGKPADDRVQDHIRAALSEALGDSQQVAKLTELCRGLEIPAPTAASCTPAMLYEIGRAIAAQAKEAAKRAEPASVQALREADRIFCWLERRTIYQDSDLKAVHAKIRAALAAHPSTDQNM